MYFEKKYKINSMSNNLIISNTDNNYRIALLENDALCEYHVENKNKKINLGDIYIGVVKKIVPGLNAAFIDIGFQKEAFLHYADLGIQIKTFISFFQDVKKNDISQVKILPYLEKEGKIADYLEKNQNIVVQIAKEPISSKGPRVSADISIAGKYIILVPCANMVTSSRRLVDKEEKKRLLRLMQSIKTTNYGIIIRTAAYGKEVAELDKDLKDTIKKWENIVLKYKDTAPKNKIYSEVKNISSILRDMLHTRFDNIFVDEKNMYEEVNKYFEQVEQNTKGIVKYYQKQTKIFEYFDVEKQIKILFGQTVSLLGGGYLIIEHTEAMHVIDVNSGRNASKENNQEDTALQVNKIAAKEIARQLRLRDMGGIIVIDFIDMKKEENSQQVLQIMKDAMQKEKAKVNILPISKFGIMQITRQRVRQETCIPVQEICPTCNGKGETESLMSIADRIEKSLDFVLKNNTKKKIIMTMHPYLWSYFTIGLISKRIKWMFKYKKIIGIEKDHKLDITEFKFLDANHQPINIT